MNKAEFVERLAKKTGFTKKDARKALDAVTEVITEALTQKESVKLVGFGKFGARARKASNRINPQTKEQIQIPRKVVPSFQAGKGLKETIARNLEVVGSEGNLKIRRRS